VESYIVRVYRRASEPGKEAAGLVEQVGSDARRAFGTRDELWSFLVEAQKTAGIPGRKRKSPRT
jgi:hypothetical protein